MMRKNYQPFVTHTHKHTHICATCSSPTQFIICVAHLQSYQCSAINFPISIRYHPNSNSLHSPRCLISPHLTFRVQTIPHHHNDAVKLFVSQQIFEFERHTSVIIILAYSAYLEYLRRWVVAAGYMVLCTNTKRKNHLLRQWRRRIDHRWQPPTNSQSVPPPYKLSAATIYKSATEKPKRRLKTFRNDETHKNTTTGTEFCVFVCLDFLLFGCLLCIEFDFKSHKKDTPTFLH